MTDSSPASSVELLERARGGDNAALEALYSRYLPRVTRWASGRLSARARHLVDTGDIVQEVMISFLRHVGDFTPRHDGALVAYLRNAVLNRIRDASRRVAARGERVALDDTDETPLPDAGPSPYEQCIARDSAKRYEEALSRLDEDERTAVILKVEFDYSPSELAQALRKPSADAARMFAHRAVLKLAKEMGHGR